MTPAERRLRAQIASNSRWARTRDRAAETEAMRRGFEARFLRMAREQLQDANPDAVLDEREVAVCAEALRRAHFCRMALRSSQSRRAKRGGAA